MRGVRISFADDGPKFDWSSPAVDFETTVQNALVNVATRRGSDLLFLDRGTDMAVDAAQGRMINEVWAGHSSNFAALRTLSFLRATEDQRNASKLQDFKLRCEGISDQRIFFEVQAISSQGEVVGFSATI